MEILWEDQWSGDVDRAECDLMLRVRSDVTAQVFVSSFELRHLNFAIRVSP